MEACITCGTAMTHQDHQVNWGSCDDCWQAMIDLDHIRYAMGDAQASSNPPGSPSPQAQHILAVIHTTVGLHQALRRPK